MSTKDEWATPADLFEALNREFAFTLDPCATPMNAKCARFFTRDDDGLSKCWAGEVVFMNPPYGRAIVRWMEKAYAESNAATVVCLIPARTDTAWWHEFVMRSDEIRYLRGRVCFGGKGKPAPFPSAIAIFRGGRNQNRGVRRRALSRAAG